MGIWWYPEKTSIKESIPCLAVASTIWSISGKGKLSFEHASFKLVQSTQTCHFPFFFGTTTTLANQSGYLTSLINPAASNLSISVWMIFCLSGWKRRTFWWMGREEGMTLSLWEATDGWIPSILEWVQAKMSLFRWSMLPNNSSSSCVSKKLV